MKVSIIIPVYNSEKFLEYCLQSCINQTYKDIEIIAVVHDSTDKSNDILKKYAEKIRIIQSQNLTAIKAINLGFKSAIGEWFKVMSSDDIMYHDCVEELVYAVKNFHGSKENTIFYSNYDEIDKYGKIIGEFKSPDFGNMDQFDRNVLFLNQSYPNFITTLFHKKIFEKYGYYDEDIKFGSDYEMMMRLGIQHECSFYFVSKPLIKYRRHKKQLSTTLFKKYPNAAEDINKIVLNRLEESKCKRYETAIKEYQSIHKKSRYKKIKKSVGNLIHNNFTSFNKK